MTTSVENNSLISLYRALSGADLRRLGKWLDSPAHNQRDDVRALHAYLTTGNRLDKTAALTKTRLWKRLFPEQPFDDAKLRQTFHWALRATEAFLAYDHWAGRAADVQLDYLAGLRKRGLTPELGRGLKKVRQLQEKTVERNETYYRRAFRIGLEQDEFRVLQQSLTAPNFQEIADALDVAYLIEKLKVSCNMLFHARAYRTEFAVRFLDETVGYIEQLPLEDHPVLTIYYYVYRGFTENDEQGGTVSRLRDTLTENGHLLTGPDRRFIILMAINICISNINQQREAFVREAFEWYRLGLSENAIIENGQLTRATFLNIVANAIKLREYDWAQGFIEENAALLEEETRQNTEYFARARLGYELKDYDTIMPLLVQVDFKHPIYNLFAKTLLLKIYFELDEYDLVENQIDAMLVYIRRKQLPDLHRNNYNNIARLTRQLARLGPDRSKRQALAEKIATTDPLTEKDWLLEQIGGAAAGAG